VGKREKKAKEAAPEKPKETTAEFIASMASVLVTGLFIITFIVQAFEIPSSSMEDTLLIGDHVFVDRVRFAPPTKGVGPLLPYGEIKRNDIVVFVSVDTPGMYIVKRIVGLPGDHLHVDHGDLYRNGEKLTEGYVVHKQLGAPENEFSHYSNNFRDYFPKYPPPPGMDMPQEWILTMGSHIENGDIVVPPDSYFGMGDNRDVSKDSRYWGFIPRANIIGRPMFVYWSFDTPRDQYEKNTIADRVKFVLHVITHFLTETRWSRTLKMIR
jgi:signal peptidase I